MNTEKDPSGLDAHAPGAKLDDGKTKAWQLVRPSWEITRLAYRDNPYFNEVDRFFAVPTDPGNVYDVPPAALQRALVNTLYWVEGVRRVGLFGSNKYTVDGYLSVENGGARYLDAAARHYLAVLGREVYDPESTFPHVYHARWNVGAAAVLLEIARE